MKQQLVQEHGVYVWKNGKPIVMELNKLVDPLVAKELDKVKYKVLHKDMDWVTIIDGEEGVGKSVLAQQLARYVDPTFNLDNIVFTADGFIKQIKDPKNKAGKAIVLDEAFNAANARASMSEVNRSLAGVATEMRQKNLFIFIVLPSFFDLDRYFALWRCRSLFHVYFNEQEDRRYIIFPKDKKKYLYLSGKKTYNYSKPRSPFPPLVFPHVYCTDEELYRDKKSMAFKKRTVSHQARKWLMQRNAYVKHLMKSLGLTQDEAAKLPTQYGVDPIDQTTISRIMKEIVQEEGGGEVCV
jgi:hypothetical protein